MRGSRLNRFWSMLMGLVAALTLSLGAEGTCARPSPAADPCAMMMAADASTAVGDAQGGPAHRRGEGRAGSPHCPGCQVSSTAILLPAPAWVSIDAPSAPTRYARSAALASLTPERDLRPPIHLSFS